MIQMEHPIAPGTTIAGEIRSPKPTGMALCDDDGEDDDDDDDDD